MCWKNRCEQFGSSATALPTSHGHSKPAELQKREERNGARVSRQDACSDCLRGRSAASKRRQSGGEGGAYRAFFPEWSCVALFLRGNRDGVRQRGRRRL